MGEWGGYMLLCPLLTTSDEKVECFSDCALYNYEENSGECPFMSQVEESNNLFKNSYEYNILKNKEKEYFSDLYDLKNMDMV